MLNFNLNNVPESEFFTVTLHDQEIQMDMILIHQMFTEATVEAREQLGDLTVEDRPWLEGFTRKINNEYNINMGTAQAYVIAINILGVLKAAGKN